MTATLARTAVLLVAGALIGAAANGARPGGVSLSSWHAKTSCDAGKVAALVIPPEMAPSEASSLCGRSDVVVADARPASAYAEGHVAGAVHLPCDAAGQVASDALAHFDRAQTIVVYGNSTAEAQPVALSLQLRHPGVRVAVLTGGFPAWSSAGLACASGPCEECSAKVSNP